MRNPELPIYLSDVLGISARVRSLRNGFHDAKAAEPPTGRKASLDAELIWSAQGGCGQFAIAARILRQQSEAEDVQDVVSKRKIFAAQSMTQQTVL